MESENLALTDAINRFASAHLAWAEIAYLKPPDFNSAKNASAFQQWTTEQQRARFDERFAALGEIRRLFANQGLSLPKLDGRVPVLAE